MPAAASLCVDLDEEDSHLVAARGLDAQDEDAYWRRSYAREPWCRPDCDYEDYAPAFCVGYIGFAQYGGRYEDAEKSLFANWERIKGDSRLGYGDAALAMRAAWDRLEQASAGDSPQWEELAVLAGEQAGQQRWGAPANQALHAG